MKWKAPLSRKLLIGVVSAMSCQRDLPQPRQLTAAIVPAAGEHSETQFDKVGARSRA
jgi:hypothetical protein